MIRPKPRHILLSLAPFVLPCTPSVDFFRQPGPLLSSAASSTLRPLLLSPLSSPATLLVPGNNRGRRQASSEHFSTLNSVRLQGRAAHSLLTRGFHDYFRFTWCAESRQSQTCFASPIDPRPASGIRTNARPAAQRRMGLRLRLRRFRRRHEFELSDRCRGDGFRRIRLHDPDHELARKLIGSGRR